MVQLSRSLSFCCGCGCDNGTKRDTETPLNSIIVIVKFLETLKTCHVTSHSPRTIFIIFLKNNK